MDNTERRVYVRRCCGLYTGDNMKHETNQKPIRWDVFIPCFAVIGGAAILGIVNNEWLTSVTSAIFGWSWL